MQLVLYSVGWVEWFFLPDNCTDQYSLIKQILVILLCVDRYPPPKKQSPDGNDGPSGFLLCVISYAIGRASKTTLCYKIT